MDIKKRSAYLAFQADRKILDLEEENYIRMDIPESGILFFENKFAPQSNRGKSFVKFSSTFLSLFLIMFTVTNGPSYAKILKAQLQSANQDSTSSVNIEINKDSLVNEIDMLGDEIGILPINIEPAPFENRLKIPAIELDARIVEPDLGLEKLVEGDWNALEDQIRASLLKGVTHYPGTAYAGEEGNFFLTGHSSNVFWEPSIYNSVFALLPSVKVGDDIYVTMDQKTHHYRIFEKKEVSPKEVSILAQDENRKTMTLMTCTPVGTVLKRLVVRAEYIGEI